MAKESSTPAPAPPPIIFAISIDRATGTMSVANNLTNENADLPLLYKALRVVEAQIFDNISRLLPTEGKVPEDGVTP